MPVQWSGVDRKSKRLWGESDTPILFFGIHCLEWNKKIPLVPLAQAFFAILSGKQWIKMLENSSWIWQSMSISKPWPKNIFWCRLGEGCEDIWPKFYCRQISIAYSVPHAYLPPSFHKRVMKDSIQWLDVYQERGSQKREAARVRLVDAVGLTHSFWFCKFTTFFSGMSLYAPFSKAV